jgi:Lar family restriction alleviation protein
MNNRLKRCPYCGGEDISIEEYDDYDVFLYYAVCLDCGAKTMLCSSESKAAYVWNCFTLEKRK